MTFSDLNQSYFPMSNNPMGYLIQEIAFLFWKYVGKSGRNFHKLDVFFF